MVYIRQGTLNDINGIKRLWQGMMNYHAKLSPYFYPAEDSGNFYELYTVNSLNNPEVLYGIASDDDSEYLGYIRSSIVNRAPIFEKRRTGMINEIFVLPENRKKGIGRKLVDFSLKWFESKGISDIMLEVSSDNDSGINFWKALGFTNYKIKMSLDYGKGR